MSDELILNPNVVIDGKQYFYSPAHQLAKYITNKKYNEFRLSCDYGYTSATLYIEKILANGDIFSIEKYEERRCIGTLFYDTDRNILTLDKTDLELEKKYCKTTKKTDVFLIQYEIFKHLRGFDLIRVQKSEKKQKYVYSITVSNANEEGYLLSSFGYGPQYAIPKSAFRFTKQGN